MKRAVIENGKVVNIIETEAETPVGFQLPLEQVLYACGEYPVAIGDSFEDGVFHRDGQFLEPMPTPEQMISKLQEKVDTLLLSNDQETIHQMERQITRLESKLNTLLVEKPEERVELAAVRKLDNLERKLDALLGNAPKEETTEQQLAALLTKLIAK